MFGWLGKLKERARPRRVKPAGPANRAQLQAIRYLVANEACVSLERALRQGDHAEAQRAIERGLSINPTFSRLTELRAWYHLDRGQADRALALLESDEPCSPRCRLLKQLVRMRTGQKALAHLALNAWAREDDCPDAARVLLATLDLEAGRTRDAQSVLTKRPELASHPLACQLLVLIELSQDSPHAARRAATILLRRFGRQEHAHRFVAGLGLAARVDEAELPIEMIDRLAEELADRPEVIPSLTAAQRCRPDRLRIELLRRAIARVVDDLPEPIEAIESLAGLAELAGANDDAVRWARRGLKLSPLNATLALLIDRSQASPSAEQTDEATEVLRRVAAAHPDYPDVQWALVLRYDRRGMTASARRLLDQWLERRADDPLAQHTRGELAA